MNQEKRKFSPPTVGGSSLLVIFAVLCLTIFALLSLSTVQADRRLGDAAAEAVEGYYAADVEAETLLARLRSGDTPAGVTLTEGPQGVTAQYVCPMSDTQALFVEVLFPEGLGDNYQILRWQAKSVTDWVPDNSIDVWNGE